MERQTEQIETEEWHEEAQTWFDSTSFSNQTLAHVEQSKSRWDAKYHIDAWQQLNTCQETWKIERSSSFWPKICNRNYQ